ncbi:3665_t:CDS:2, partial [Racocetra fulgida]
IFTQFNCFIAITITRPSKRKQQLKVARAKKHAYVIKELDYENLNDHIWSDKDIDERASDYFAVLLTAELKKAAQNTQSITAYFASTLMHSNVASASTSTCELSTELFASMEVEPMEVEPEPMEMELTEVRSMDVESAELGLTEVESDVSVKIDEKTKMRLAIEELDGMLKKDNNQMDKGVRVRLQASLQYLRLKYYHGQNKINASTTIASSLGWEII